MKRPVRPEEVRIWARVAATVRPAPGRLTPEAPDEPVLAGARGRSGPRTGHAPDGSSALGPAAARRTARTAPPEHIEPNRKRRIAHGREPIEARLDLHGYDQDRARQALHDFIARAYASGARAVLVITGKGVRGDGVLRRRAPEWLAEPPVRAMVAGISAAERRHGGEGALYVALKRRAG